MPYLLLGLLALVIAMAALRWYVAASPATLARWLRAAGIASASAAGLLLMSRGYPLPGIGAALVALWLLTGPTPPWLLSGRPGGAAQRPASRIVTDHLDLELDHDSGTVRGRVLRGFFAGRDIETLRPVELAHLWADCRFADPSSAQVLEAYLDRVHPTWRDDMARTSGGEGAGQEATETGPMTRETALDILGLGPDASEEDIRRAHRDLMLKLHPDRGGSHTLAAAVNKAKDTLLGRG
jgi:hypothetical protein